MPCETHSWWFGAPCPKCADVKTAYPEILARLARGPAEQRLWTQDNMDWVMAPLDAKVGETHTWAGKKFKVEAGEGDTLRIKLLRSS